MNFSKFRSFDAAEYLDNDEAIEHFLNDAIKSEDPKYILLAFLDIIRASVITDIANEMNIDRKEIFKALTSNNGLSQEIILKTISRLLNEMSDKKNYLEWKNNKAEKIEIMDYH